MGLFKKLTPEKKVRFDFDPDCWEAAEQEKTIGKYACGKLTDINRLVRGTVPYQSILVGLEDAMTNAHRQDLPAHLEREPNNPHDELATKVIVAGHVVGYLAREQAGLSAVYIDAIEAAGKYVAGKIIFVGGEDGNRLGIRFDMPDLKKLAKTFS